ncbi:MAG: pirin family protein [Myxococcales bacterium]|nr:pirin family protein [Myxococcales bacterium]
MTSRRVVASVALEEARMGAGFTARSLRGRSLALDPFLSIDEFHMSLPTFPPHPHAGFSAVTYMLEDSAGAFVNRDSLGDTSRIGPGDLHWTQAARGMMHEEIPERPGVDCHGLQMFVNLRRADKQAPPRAFHLDRQQVPVFEAPGARVRVLAGALGGLAAPLEGLLTDAFLFDVQLSPSARLVLDVDPTHNVFALALSGDGTADPEGAPIAASPSSSCRAVGFAREGNTLSLASGPHGLHLIVGGGAPLGEPVVFGGPFVMTSPEDISDAFARFARGEMGRLAPSA